MECIFNIILIVTRINIKRVCYYLFTVTLLRLKFQNINFVIIRINSPLQLNRN